jgi:alanine racemase
VIGAFGRSRPDHGDFQSPTLGTLPEAVAGNLAIARAGTRARIMAVVKADGYGHGACTVARAAVAAGAEWVGRTDIAEASELRATGLTVQIPHSTVQDGLESAAVPPSRGPRQPLEPGKEPKHQPMGGPSDGRI